MIQIQAEDIVSINTLAKRMVENQQRSATLALVGFDPAKHDLLESLLEDAKPPVADALEKRHYLIKTPFRYPPLRYGSRFGRRHERGIFYASLSERCLLAEVAFYRFVFLDDMETPFSEAIVTEHSVFDARIRSERAICLDQGRLDQNRTAWRDPVNYSACQTLGAHARENNIEVIQYYSARDTKGGRNLAVLNPDALAGNPRNMQAVRCTLTGMQCHFLMIDRSRTYSYAREMFEVDGCLPRPSN